MKRVIIPTLTFWLIFLVMQGYYFLADTVWHLSFVPLLMFALALAFLFSVTNLMIFWCILVGPRRLEAFGWGALTLLPVFVVYSQCSLYFALEKSVRTEPYEPRLYVAPCSAMQNALIDGVIRFRPHRQIESERVVLFYDDRTPAPRQIVEEMNAFLKQEEEFFGVTMPHKLHWVRDSVFGFPGFAPFGIAVADPDYDQGQSPDPRFHLLNHMDRHEASHNVSFSTLKKTSPPMMLIEGWAEYRSADWKEQALSCLHTRDAGCLLTLQEMVSPQYYYSSDERIYYQGAALTHFLIETFGTKKFVELFSSCKQETFTDDVEKIYGMTLDELDQRYFQAIEACFSFEEATKNCSAEEKRLLEEFRVARKKQKDAYDKLFADCTINMFVRSLTETETEKIVFEHDCLLRSREGGFYRLDTKTHTNEDEYYPYDLHTVIMIVPNRHYNISQWDCPPDYLHATTTDARYIVDQRLQGLHFHVIADKFLPESVLCDKSLETILWRPEPGTTIKSVVEKNENCVVVTIQCQLESCAEQYRLTLNPQQNWALQEIEFSQPQQGLLPGLTAKEIREYEGEYHGIPLIKTCTIDETFFNQTSQRKRKTHKNFARIDTTSCSEDVFTEASLGVGEIEVVGIPTQSLARMDRHQRLVATWFVVSVVLIIFARIRWRQSQRKEPKPEPQNDQEPDESSAVLSTVVVMPSKADFDVSLLGGKI